MDDREEADRALRMQIAEEAAAEKAISGTIFTRAFQFFLVPMIIVLSCVGIYWFFTTTMADRRTPEDWLREMKEGGPVARKHAAVQLVAELRRLKPEERRASRLFEPILDMFKTWPANEPGTDSMTKSLVGEGPTMRALLAQCLGLIGDPRATPALLEVLKEDRNPQTQAACIDAIGALRDREAAPDLLKLLDHPSTIVRKYATFTLGALAAPEKEGGAPSLPEAVEPLKARLKDPRPEVQWNAAFVLAYYLRDASGAQILRRMLDRNYVTEIVTTTSREPGDVGEQTAAYAPALIAHVLRMGCTGAGVLADRSLSDALRAVAESDSEIEVRAEARKALDAIAKKR